MSSWNEQKIIELKNFRDSPHQNPSLGKYLNVNCHLTACTSISFGLRVSWKTQKKIDFIFEPYDPEYRRVDTSLCIYTSIGKLISQGGILGRHLEFWPKNYFEANFRLKIRILRSKINRHRHLTRHIWKLQICLPQNCHLAAILKLGGGRLCIKFEMTIINFLLLDIKTRRLVYDTICLQ